MCARERPFKAKSMPALILAICENVHEPIPLKYSNELSALVDQLLNKDPNLRPTIEDILNNPLIKPVAKRIIHSWGQVYEMEIKDNEEKPAIGMTDPVVNRLFSM